MGIFFWSTVFLLSLMGSLGQILYTVYVVGDKTGSFVLIEDGQPSSAKEFEVSADEMPVRLNLTIEGERLRRSKFASASFEFTTGGDAKGDTVGYLYSFSEEGDVARSRVSVGQVNFRNRTSLNRVRTSTLLEDPSPGNWRLAATVSDERDYELKRLEATVIKNAGVVNLAVVVPVGLLAIIAFIMLIVTLRRRYPHLAS